MVYWEKMVGTEEGSLEYKQLVNLTNLLKQRSSAIAFSFAWFLHFFNDHDLLFVLGSIVANHKTATEADVLNKTARVLNYVPDKPGTGEGVQMVSALLLIWNNNLWYQKKNELHKWSVVDAKSIYTNEKQCLPLFYRQPPYMNPPPPHF